MTFEIIIPLRNPTEVLSKTLESIISQADKNFSILISDNHSTAGQEHIESAFNRLKESGLAVRKITPPVELGRVEHWNWAHYQSGADWLKPLFVGDWLEPGYVARIREAVVADPSCRYVRCHYILHRHDGQPLTVAASSNWSGRFYTPAEMQDVVLRYGMQFGPPSCSAYERAAFVAIGGYAPALPITADCLFFCILAARFGVMSLAEPLLNFNIHADRFSKNLPKIRRETLQESYTFLLSLAYHAWTENIRIPVFGFLRLLLRTYKNYLMGR